MPVVNHELIKRLPKFIIQSEFAQSDTTTDLHKMDKVEDRSEVTLEISQTGRNQSSQIKNKGVDSDFDKVMNLMTDVKSTMIKQAETAKLAQANQTPNSVLELLRQGSKLD